jgi:tetratricopeptide (TPR) repeat protein
MVLATRPARRREAIRLFEDAVALLLDDLGRAEDAERVLRAYAASAGKPTAALVLARFLSRHGRLPEALALCEKAWQTCPPEAVAFTCVRAVRDGAAGQEQLDRVEGWLTAAVRKNPRSARLLVLLAELQDQRGDHAKAARAYRTILAQDGQNTLALNNLAYLLAVREGDAQEALELINRAINRDGPVAELLDTRALVYLKAGQPERAVQDLQKAVVEDPSGPKYFHLARAHGLANNPRAAAAAFRKALDAGLQDTGLHALERPAFRQMAGELGRDP